MKVERLINFFNPISKTLKSIKFDKNMIDKDFYIELLYILGLKESKINGKKKLVSNLNQQSFISVIERKIIEKNKDKMNIQDVFDIALELASTWINRLLFLKLLDSLLIKFNNNEISSFLNFNNIASFKDISDLFFQVISVKPNERLTDLKNKYIQIPYLNNSLFEKTVLEQNYLSIDEIENSDINIYKSTVIVDENGERIDGIVGLLDYLLVFIDMYDFSNDIDIENVFRFNKKIPINSAVFGKIFEKVNGFKDGSYYTPSYITEQMCKESITKLIIQKINEKKRWNSLSINKIKDKINSEIKNGNKEIIFEIREIINSLKICDPAVGTGHFLVSVLNEIIRIKSKLGILIDENGNQLSCNIDIKDDELIIKQGKKIFSYNSKDKDSYLIQKSIFHEKEEIILNNLFGIDINPKSVEICKIRLWIELLKHNYYDEETNQLQPLLNIDLIIQTGDSLISKYDIDNVIGNEYNDKKNELIKLRKEFVNIHDENKKKEYIKRMNELKKDFDVFLNNNIKSNNKNEVKVKKKNDKNKSNQITLMNFLEQNKSNQNKIKIQINKDAKLFPNSFDWILELPEMIDDNGKFIGFDLIIGNPPYIYLNEMNNEYKNFLQNKYTKDSDDLYMFFVHRGFELMKVSGIIHFITPNTYFTLNTKTNFRIELLKYSDLIFRYSGFCFEDAYVETMIFSACKKPSNNKSKLKMIYDNDVYEIDYNAFKNNLFLRFFIPNSLNVKINDKINTSLKSLYERFEPIFNGKQMKTNDLNVYHKSLKNGDITLLGLVTDGEQGLVTGNNSKYIAEIINSENEIKIIDNEFINAYNKFTNSNLDLNEFENNREKYYSKAEDLKKTYNKPDLFGKYFIYKWIHRNNVKEFNELNENEKLNGGNDDLWVFYHRGNKSGDRWQISCNNAINWSTKSVNELKYKIGTDSRWQGYKFFDYSGFAWVDYFTNKLKSFLLDASPYSKNTVKLTTNYSLLSDKYIVALLNSKFIIYYIKSFITATHSLQIKDGRLIPIIIPSKKIRLKIENYVDEIIKLKNSNDERISDIENEIDKLVYELYGLELDDVNEIQDVNETKN